VRCNQISVMSFMYRSGNYCGILEKFSNIKLHEIQQLGVELFHSDKYAVRLYEAKVGFQNFANVHNDENFGYCTCLCGICNYAYYVTKFFRQPKHKL
jgi:hypothetical protein